MTIKSCQSVLRSVSQFHENEKLVAWLKDRPPIHYLTPERRRWVLFVGAFAAGLIALFNRNAEWRGSFDSPVWLAPLVDFPVFLGLIYLLYLAAARFRKLPAVIRRRPHLLLHLLFWAALAVLWWMPSDREPWRAALVLFTISLPYLIWRCDYMILSGQRGKAAATRFRDHLFYLWPLWGGTNTPFGKGFDYLSRCEAKTPEAYARSVLAGTKILLLVLFWEAAKLAMGAAVYADSRNPLLSQLGGYSLAIPRLKYIAADNSLASLPITWLSLYLELVWETLDVAASGHGFIGALRLFGFNVFRNTYKPLLAESTIEYWGRYYYYFKELMFELFFFPTYLRYFKSYPKLRMFTSVFAAAFVGNMYYHVLREKNGLVAGQFKRISNRLGPRIWYCLIFAVGIFISMLHQQKREGKIAAANTAREKLLKVGRIAWVWTYFGLLNVWSSAISLPVAGRVKFFFSLFGLR